MPLLLFSIFPSDRHYQVLVSSYKKAINNRPHLPLGLDSHDPRRTPLVDTVVQGSTDMDYSYTMYVILCMHFIGHHSLNLFGRQVDSV